MPYMNEWPLTQYNYYMYRWGYKKLTKSEFKMDSEQVTTGQY